MVLKKIGVGSCAKVSGVLYGGLGLIFGCVFALASLVGAGMGAGKSGLMGAVFGVGAIVLMPLLYGLMGLVFGAITAALYNLTTKFVGGVDLDLQ